jgi:hypothetical protein
MRWHCSHFLERFVAGTTVKEPLANKANAGENQYPIQPVGMAMALSLDS